MNAELLKMVPKALLQLSWSFNNLFADAASWISSNVAATAALFIAIFSEHLKRLFWHPKLDVQCACNPPDCLKVPMSNPQTESSYPGYYFRIRVGNVGWSSAENAEVIVEELYERQADGRFKKRQDFQALNLLWSHYGKPWFDAIPPSIYRHCDLGHVMLVHHLTWPSASQTHQPERSVETFNFNFVVQPNTGQGQIRPGTYRLRIAAVASNARMTRRTIELVFSGRWYDDEATMLRDGVSLRLV